MVCAYICYGTFYTQGCHCCTLNFPWSQWIYIVVGCSKLLLFFGFFKRVRDLRLSELNFVIFPGIVHELVGPFILPGIVWVDIFLIFHHYFMILPKYSAKLESYQWGSPFPSKGLKDLFPTLFVTKQIFTPTKFVLVSDLLHLKRMIWTSNLF